jgi:hypothetical protein
MQVNKLFFILSLSFFLVEHLHCANYEAYEIFSKGTSDLKIGYIGNCTKNYEKITDLDKEALSVYKNLVYLCWLAKKTDKAFKIAQKIDEIGISNPQTIRFLATLYLAANAKQCLEKTLNLGQIMHARDIRDTGNTYTYAPLNKLVQDWISYSISFDFKENKNIRKKLDSLQKQMPLEELYKQMLLRSERNYLKLSPFKTGFKTKISSSFLSKKFYIPFSYYKNNLAKIDLSAMFILRSIFVQIKNGTYEFVPKTLETQLPQEIINIISKTCELLSDNFYKEFADAKITKKGKRIIYSKDGRTLVLNLDTALIESFSDKDLTVTIFKYEKFGISSVPKKIKFSFKNIKIKGLLKVTKIYPILSDDKNENNSQSSGKN